jgi:hypothetical protein
MRKKNHSEDVKKLLVDAFAAGGNGSTVSLTLICFH